MNDIRQVFHNLDKHMELNLGVLNTPGVVVGITDRKQLLGVRAYGYADLQARTPLQPETLFEIGSISKSFTCIILLQLQADGLIDLHHPVSDYLPWFQVQTAYEPVTIHHLMTHTAGIIRESDYLPSQKCAAWNLRDTHASVPPGSMFHYSNDGYKVLGLVIQQLTGKPIWQALQERVLSPLGMEVSTPMITHQVRERLAVGHEAFYDDRPLSSDGKLAPATWLEFESADGPICSNAEDMCKYLRMILNRGTGLISPAAFDLFIKPVIPTDDGQHGEHYGYGMISLEVDGHHVVGHSGGMVGYYSVIAADLDTGLGVVVFVNGPTEPWPICEYALKLALAEIEGGEVPPPPPAPFFISNASEYAGVYHNGAETLTFQVEDDALYLVHNTEKIRLEKLADDRFYTNHPQYDLFPFSFGKQDDRVVEVHHGYSWFVNEHYSGQTTFEFPPEWQAYTGHYRSHNPWLTNFRILPRKGGLALVYPDGEEEPLFPTGENEFGVGADPRSPERIRFYLMIDNQAHIANLSGGEYCRFFTP